MSDIKKPDTWAEGRRKIDWVRANMPLLNRIEKKFKEERPFEGLKVALSIHLEAKSLHGTAVRSRNTWTISAR